MDYTHQTDLEDQRDCGHPPKPNRREGTNPLKGEMVSDSPVLNVK